MSPRKRPLLDVLREKERRQQGRREDGVAPPPTQHGGAALFLPTWLWPALGGGLLLVLAVWGLSKCSFGSSTSPGPEIENTEAVVEEGLAVLAITYDASQEDRARKVGRSLRDDFGYDVRLMRNTGPSGTELREVYVLGSTSRNLEPAALLEEVQALSLPENPNDLPFAGAILRQLPEAE